MCWFWAACSMARFIGGRCGWKESTCSIGRVLLDLPMGVMRERGMARCCMIDNAEWAVLGESEDGSMRLQVQMQNVVGCVELGGDLCVVQKHRKSRWRVVWNIRYR